MKHAFRFLIFLFFASCVVENPYDEMIIGQWKGHEWFINDSTVKQKVDSIYFNFEQDSIYNASYVGSKQEGKYWLRENRLYTQINDKLEVMVKISSLNADTMVFEMNRGGTPETLILTRQK